MNSSILELFHDLVLEEGESTMMWNLCYFYYLGAAKALFLTSSSRSKKLIQNYAKKLQKYVEALEKLIPHSYLQTKTSLN